MTSTYDSSFPSHGIKSVSGYGNLNYYDANGNRTWRLTNGNSGVWHYLVWDHENRLYEVQNGSSLVLERYFYDVDGQRIRKTNNNIDTYYPNQYYEQSSGLISKYYYFGGQRIAQRNNGTLYYLHNDRLGGMALTTSSAGDATLQYYAYGRRRGGTGSTPTRKQYTGQYIDDTGLYYYTAYGRYRG